MWICIVPRREHTSKVLRYGACFQGISQLYLHTPRSSANGWTIPVFAFPAKAGPHLPTTEGWKAELACVAGYIQK